MKQDTFLDPLRRSLDGPQRVVAFEKYAQRLAASRERLTGKPLPHSSQGFTIAAQSKDRNDER